MSEEGQKTTEVSAITEIWPVYKGVSFNLWESDTGDYYDSAYVASITEHLQQKRLAQSRATRSAFAELPRSMVEDSKTLPCRHPRIAFRNVTNPTNTRTIITALIPPNRVITHHAPYLLRIAGSSIDEAYVLGVLCSMPCDWQARRTVELNMTFEQINLLTIPDPGQGHPVRDRVVEIAGRLAAQDERFSAWAEEVGVPVGSVTDKTTKQDLLCELDACVSYLYGLDEQDIATIYATFDAKHPHRYAEHHQKVLVHYRRLPQPALPPQQHIQQHP
ncbi:MAG: hypothetical protein OXI96_00470 [Acidimicrobiaceae bacterium]|nr:hypothetical protein [Acidimicrobiaceae bacterium]